MAVGIIQINFLLIMGQSTSTHDQAETETSGSTAKLAEQFSHRDEGSVDWLQLDDQEEILWMGSPTLRRLVVPFGFSILCLCGGLFAIAIGVFELFGDLPSSLRWAAVAGGGLLIVVPLVLDFFLYWSHQRIQYVITTDRLYRKWDNSKITQIKTGHVSTSTYQQSWLDRQFSCGQVHVTNSKTGRKKLFYSATPAPEYVQDIVMDQAVEQVVDRP